MMRLVRIFLFFISLFCFQLTFAQDTKKNVIKKTRLNNTYGLRLGFDLSKVARTIANRNFSGFEINGDYRISKKYYFAAEIGSEKYNFNKTSINTTTNGGYLKVGLDYNVFKNLLGMRNLIFVGVRYGIATFKTNLNNFSIATQNSFFDSSQIDSRLSNSELTAHWAEFLAGTKVEVLNNLFLGFTVSVKGKIAENESDGFDNPYIPGFGETNDFSKFTTGFNYYISYYIPLYKKTKKKNVNKKTK